MNTKPLFAGTAIVVAIAVAITVAFVDQPPTPPTAIGANPPEPSVAQTPAPASNDGPADTLSLPSTPVSEEAGAEVKSEAIDPVVKARVELMAARRDGKAFDAEAVHAAMKLEEAWQESDEVADLVPHLEPDERFDGREFVRINPLKIESLVAGDTMNIPLAQESAIYQLEVTDVVIHDESTITWNGRLTDFNESNLVTITRGDSMTIGGITTPNGHFTLQTYGDVGWIASSATLAKNLHGDQVDPEAEE